MISFEYAAGQIAAVWRMARNKSGWNALLDKSADGVFRSFFAIIFAAPFAMFSYVAVHRAAPLMPEIPPSPLLSAPVAYLIFWEFAAYAADWGVSIAALIIVARAIDAAHLVPRSIVAFNWAQVLTAMAQAAPFAAMVLTRNASLVGAVAIPTLAFSLFLYWGVLRRGLDANPGVTIALIATFALIGVFVSTLVTQLGIALLGAFQ